MCERCTAAEEERDKLTLELEGDGSRGSAALTSLGLRACFELRGENIALLNAEKDAAEASLSALRQQIRELRVKIQEFDGTDMGVVAYLIDALLAAPASPQEKP